MRINLMPVIPRTQRFKFPIFLIVAIIILGASGLVALDSYEKLQSYNQAKQEHDQLIVKKERLERELLANREEGQVFTDYYTLFNKADQGHYDWTIVLDAIAAELPENGVITKLNLTGTDQLLLGVELPSVILGSQLIQVFDDAAWTNDVSTVVSDFNEGELLLELALTVDFEPLLKEGR